MVQESGNFSRKYDIQISWYRGHAHGASSISLKYSFVQFAIPFAPIMAEGVEGGGIRGGAVKVGNYLG